MYTSKVAKHSLLTTGIVGLMSLSGLIGASPASAIELYKIENDVPRIGDVVLSEKFAEAGISKLLGKAEVLLSTYPGAEDTSSFSANPAVVTTDLEDFLSLKAGSLKSQSTNQVFQGSAITQSFTASINDTFSFSFNFLTDEDVISSNAIFDDVVSQPNKLYNDFAFLTILLEDKNNKDSSTKVIRLADTFFEFRQATTLKSFISETGWLTYSTSLLESGTYTIGFGIADVGDTGFSSGLLLKNIQISNSPPAQVPTPNIFVSGVAFGFGSLMKRQLTKKSILSRESPPSTK